MSRAAVSIVVFGWYFLAIGIVMAVVPNVLLAVLRIPPTHEPWIRILGTVVAILGLYYLAAAREENTGFFRWTTMGRTIVLPAFIALVVFAGAPPATILFGVIDAAGALWTAMALRRRAS